jgi:hypothetical protein
MSDIVTRLRAALDAEAEVAQAAGAAEWSLQEHSGDTVLIYDSHGEPVVYDEGWPTPAQAAHIVAHGPTRVLADIASKRKILDEAEAAAADAEADTHDHERGTYSSALDYVVELLAEAYGITA